MWARACCLAVLRIQKRRISLAFNQLQRLTQLTVDPFCKIKIETACPLTLRPLDLLDCPDSNLVKITSASRDGVLKYTDSRESGQQVIHIRDCFESQNVLVEVPVKANLEITNTDLVTLSDFQSDCIEVQAGCIKARNIKGKNIRLWSEGEIDCSGSVLAKNLEIRTDSDGSISLDKVLGDYAIIQSEKGKIIIKSCYSQSSSIQTQTGDLHLMNIHRNCTVDAKSSNVLMTGFNGTLLMTLGKGSADIQFSELQGESVIVAHHPVDFHLKLSESVARSTYVHASVKPENLQLDSVLEPGKGNKENGASTLNTSECPNKLFVQTQGLVRITQLSWAETVLGKTPGGIGITE